MRSGLGSGSDSGTWHNLLFSIQKVQVSNLNPCISTSYYPHSFKIACVFHSSIKLLYILSIFKTRWCVFKCHCCLCTIYLNIVCVTLSPLEEFRIVLPLLGRFSCWNKEILFSCDAKFKNIYNLKFCHKSNSKRQFFFIDFSSSYIMSIRMFIQHFFQIKSKICRQYL